MTARIPNPFYQIYAGEALLAGAEPWFIDLRSAPNSVPDFDSVPAAVFSARRSLFCEQNVHEHRRRYKAKLEAPKG